MSLKFTFNVLLFMIGGALILLSFILLLISYFQEESYLLIAMNNVFIVPIIWGTLLILLGIFLGGNKEGVLGYVIKGFILVIFLFMFISTLKTPYHSVMDVRAVINNDLEVLEDEVVSTYIHTRYNSGRNVKRRNTYIQYFELKNINYEFSLTVSNKEDYKVHEGNKYEFVILPYSKQILEYNEIK